MGNCQAIDAATLVIQHPSGKEEKFYWSVSASEIMKANPGHYVALLISTTLCPSNPNNNGDQKDKNLNQKDNNNNNSTSVRLTRIKLLRPTDTLVLGQVYRLITTQEVMKGLWAKKQAKVKRSHSNQVEAEQPQERVREKPVLTAARRSEASELEKDNQVAKHERGHRPRTAATSSTHQSASTARSRTWQPSLHSISEATG
ncbi:PREDICTED: uncharacterized protein LOC103338308 [Prunus mume]|uniref:Uncharacterized protein LOC103338308 n=1 Tax=Prunus mume TaxID=102107 RepID=A0ABM0PHJ8_PRUMU|nr:PREDICTED: uncharacterized protein LOC103338308 [Prunus mume]